MKRSLRKQILSIFVIILCLFLVACGTGTGGGNEGVSKKYNEANYQMDTSFTFEKTLTLEEVKTALQTANQELAKAKSYSYTNKIVGIYNEEYTYEGVTKIDVTGATPMASIELSGPTTYAFYVGNNKAYINENGYKTSCDVESDLSDLIEVTSQSIGVFVSFDEENITTESLLLAGVDKDDSTVIKYQVNESAEAMIVINGNKIMKVLYSNTDKVMDYIANYNYNKVTVELPTDLDSYVSE